MPIFYEFFAGGGMARAGLEPNWRCSFANEIDIKKSKTYRANWGNDVLTVRDVAHIAPLDLPGIADLAWASFPCQDLSLAGAGEGLKGDRSGTFWPFWRLIGSLNECGRAPPLIVLENVCGALTSHRGQDFVRIGRALTDGGYQVGAVVLDAAAFLPHSRPRLFMIGVRENVKVPDAIRSPFPLQPWHTRALIDAHGKLDQATASRWIWWSIPVPRKSTAIFADLIEAEPTGVRWHTSVETARLLSMMSEINVAKVKEAQRAGRRMVGSIYKRTRRDVSGRKVQRAEVRFDDISGCLRTPAGGSSRQVVLIVEGEKIRSRLISPRETARLMGLSDNYVLPENYNEAYHLTGDGVAVPVVRHLASYILEPLLLSVDQSAGGENSSRRVAA